jgi:hypothetical protein
MSFKVSLLSKGCIALLGFRTLSFADRAIETRNEKEVIVEEAKVKENTIKRQ